MNYEKFMHRAISNANLYKFTAKPNPVVGAILIKGEKIISEGYHEIFGQNHAEINAINNAKKKIDKEFKSFSELVLICTLEPCSHVGKTGSCAQAIVKTGIKKVVIGSIDPNPLVSGNGIKILEVFQIAKSFKRNNNAKPLILMGYYNMIYQYGENKFLSHCKKAGVNGLIVVDLPWPENDFFAKK